jgi:hypothetical protein
MEKLVNVYYNDVFVSVSNEESYEVYSNCQYVSLPISDAERIAEEKIESGEWYAYLIPSMIKDRKIIYHL